MDDFPMGQLDGRREIDNARFNSALNASLNELFVINDSTPGDVSGPIQSEELPSFYAFDTTNSNTGAPIIGGDIGGGSVTRFFMAAQLNHGPGCDTWGRFISRGVELERFFIMVYHPKNTPDKLELRRKWVKDL